MTTAIIIAGGIGHRMEQRIPKQFINVYDKPVIVYTLESFQKHPMIDSVVTVCLDGWHDVLQAYARQFGISKLTRIVPGGATAQESIRNGVYALEGECADNDIIVIHDGIRPLVDAEVLTDVILKCRYFPSLQRADLCSLRGRRDHHNPIYSPRDHSPCFDAAGLYLREIAFCLSSCFCRRDRHLRFGLYKHDDGGSRRTTAFCGRLG